MDRAWTIFNEALERDGAERSALLDRACAGDAKLRAEVDGLLAVLPEAERSLRTGAGAARAGGGALEVSSPCIGPYRLVRPLGEGGMGVVFLAEQESPVRRTVALKLVKLGLDTRAFVARFDHERQALARMNHPGIAHVYDAGATEAGRPYFVMEYVPGLPLGTYVTEKNLALRDRLDLFVALCEAVQHAHQKGIIHRDLKPSNVLVVEQDGRVTPKVIDFGVAKATGSDDSGATLLTGSLTLVGTPVYMSPEQAVFGEADVDTRSDVYSLGVILYELLVGAPPIAPATRETGGGLEETLRRVREDEPPKPSVRAAPSAGRALRGDLDAIALKALEKERARRYATAQDLAEDVRRHLRHEPIAASAPSVLDRAWKFARRNRLAVASAAALAVVLAGGVVGTSVGLVKAVRSKEDALNSLDTSREVSDFLIGLFSVADPGSARGNTITAREILDRGARRIDAELTSRPVVRARLLLTMGRVYQGLGLYDQAEPLLRSAVEAREKIERPAGLEVAEALYALSIVNYYLARFADARGFAERSLEIRERLLGPRHADVARSAYALGSALFGLDEFEHALALDRRAVAIAEETLGPDHSEVGEFRNEVGLALHQLGRTEEAADEIRKALAIRRRALGDDHPDTASMLSNLAAIEAQLGRQEEALRMFRDALALRERVLGPDHVQVGYTLYNLGVYEAQWDLVDDAARDVARAEAIFAARLEADHPTLASCRIQLGTMKEDRGEADAAESLYRRALEALEKAPGQRGSLIAVACTRLGNSLRGRGDPAGAIPYLERTVAIRESLEGASAADLPAALADLEASLRAAGRAADADKVAARATALGGRSGGP